MKKISEIYTKASEFYKLGFHEECEELLSECAAMPEATADILLLNAINFIATGKYDKLSDCIEKIRILELHSYSEFHNLAFILEIAGRKGEAVENYEKALAIKPDYIPSINNLANLYKAAGELSKALNTAMKGIKTNSNSYELNTSAGNILVSLGKIQEALPYYRKAIELNPEASAPVSNFLLSLNYSGDYSRESIARKHFSMTARLAASNKKTFSFNIGNYKSNKIRIAYISGDFRRHSVAFFFEPLMHFHDRKKFEFFCYSDVKRPDTVTERIRKSADKWTDISSLSDENAAEQIYNDKINILVDLAGHTGERVKVFIMKPAPVQVTYLGYPNTTGLSSMDYRITDMLSDPRDADKLYSEKLIRFKKSFLAYSPPADAPPVSELPAIKNKFVTFGSFNNFPKMTPLVLQTWAKILNRVPASRLILKNMHFKDKNIRKNIFSIFSAENISEDRISLLTFENTLQKHLDIYNQIDIALDTFPYNGTTTTFEALWMGVPTLTLLGDRHASRVGLSILAELDLKTLVAESLDNYVKKAVFYAENPSLSAELRSVLRNILASSSFCDAKSFVKELEAFYSEAWNNYLCGR